jgi:predicted deacylase
MEMKWLDCLWVASSTVVIVCEGMRTWTNPATTTATATATATAMKRQTSQIQIPSVSIGQQRFLMVHQYGEYTPGVTERAYIQASLHADEIPGLLVNHHLIHLLDAAAAQGKIKKCIVIIPYANPVGLSQQLLGNHLGRFNIDTGINFNRDWPDVTSIVAGRVESQLKADDAAHNVRLIRAEIERAIDEDRGQKEESRMKKALFRIASTSDIVLDLHCDSDAVMHMYTHTRLWPQMRDLACELQSECQIISELSGGNPFDEACSCIWASLADKFPAFPIPMACQSVTVELRGENQVCDVQQNIKWIESDAFYCSYTTTWPQRTRRQYSDSCNCEAILMEQVTCLHRHPSCGMLFLSPAST